jgi:hypothetical protein
MDRVAICQRVQSSFAKIAATSAAAAVARIGVCQNSQTRSSAEFIWNCSTEHEREMNHQIKVSVEAPRGFFSKRIRLRRCK